MSRRCPSCGNINDDSLGFCSECGEPVDPDVRLAMDLKDATANRQPKKQASQPRHDNYTYEPVADDEDDGRKSPLLWLLLAVLAFALIVLIINLAG